MADRTYCNAPEHLVELMADSPVPLLALIDWDTSRRFAWISERTRQSRLATGRARAEERLEAIFEALAATAHANFPMVRRFNCEVRVYHGWHRGTTPTDDFRALAVAVDRTRRLFGGLHVSRVTLACQMLFGSESYDSESSKLFGTVRRREDQDADEQKMVDTALSADLLHWARRNLAPSAQALIFVMAEDDDFYPPVALANHWGVKARLVRRREALRHMPWMDRLLLKLQSEGEG
ncbi:MAG: hypothetical protein IPO09_17540 [Anaeromyxobacter sp.]|nr:hypothetical protein [Anaeromyxobacter sp.]MBL0276497.1 hypothetical protein [Anaeromyxobacter sp.]